MPDRSSLTDKMKKIRLLLLDVDGVMTDGSIIYNDRNEETKVFNARDGLGMRLAMDAGIEIGLVTGRASPALQHRCRNLRITRLFDGVTDKAGALAVILADTGGTSEETAYVGDDLVDLPIMNRVGLSIAVADAHEAVQDAADMVTSAKGGAGAVREVCEALLKAQGLWEKILDRLS